MIDSFALDLSATSPLYAIAVICLALLLALMTVHFSPFFSKELDAKSGAQHIELDGLRGFLALSIIITHASSYYYFYHIGGWHWPPSLFYTLIGQFSVSLFFQLSGFLFWRYSIERAGRIKLPHFYINRLLRLMPMQLFSVGLGFIIVGIQSQWLLRVPLEELLYNMYRWLTLDIVQWLKTGNSAWVDLNAVDNSWLVIGIMWTLRYEYLFYFLLPAVALFSKPKLFPIMLPIFILGQQYMHEYFHIHNVTANFISGFAAAWLITVRPNIPFMRSPIVSILMIITVLVCAPMDTKDYSSRQIMLMFVVILPVYFGNSMLGIFRMKATRLLGTISYSLYMLHIPVFSLSLYFINQYTPLIHLSALGYWFYMLAILSLIIGLGLITHRWIEYPCMQLGIKVYSRKRKSV